MLSKLERRKLSDRAYYKRNFEAIRARRPKVLKAFEQRHPLHYLVQKARATSRYRGLEFTITADDVVWPTHCPVLGVELCYHRERKRAQANRSNYPTLDRWDNSKGYVPGNVFIISGLANQTKSRLTVEAMESLVRYMKVKPSLLGVGTIDPKAIYPDQEPYVHKNTPEAIRAKVEGFGWQCVTMDPVGPQGAVRGRITIHCPKHAHTSSPSVENFVYRGQGCRYCGFARLRIHGP